MSFLLSSLHGIELKLYRDGWLCNGEVISEPSRFIHDPPPFLVIDIVHRIMTDPTNHRMLQIDLKFHDSQRTIKVGLLT